VENIGFNVVDNIYPFLTLRMYSGKGVCMEGIVGKGIVFPGS
jgi:hypothetical protein